MVVIYVRKPPMVLNQDGSFPLILEPSPELLAAAKKIATVADFIVIPSNTPHLFQNQIESASGLKVLSIVDVTIEEIKKRKPKNVGVLAVGVTLREKLYQDRLDDLEIAWETIDDDLVEKLDESIKALMEGHADEKARKVVLGAVELLRSKGVDGIILGCTELPLLLGKYSQAPDLINPAELLAQAAVRKAI